MADDPTKWLIDTPEPTEDTTSPGRSLAAPTLAELLARATSDQDGEDRLAAVVRGASDGEPVVGVFDNDGIVWPVEDVRVLDGVPLPDRAIVRLGFPGGLESSLVMALRDFTDLLQACGLRAAHDH